MANTIAKIKLRNTFFSSEKRLENNVAIHCMKSKDIKVMITQRRIFVSPVI
jgi:hypothetical protein